MRNTTRLTAFLAAAGLFFIAHVFPQDATDRKTEDAPRLRRPVALLLVDEGERLLVANRDSGTITTLDTESRKTVAEVKVGRRLADIATTAAGDRVLAADEDAGEVILLERTA